MYMQLVTFSWLTKLKKKMDNQVMNTFNALVQSLLSSIEIIDALLSSMFPCCWQEINKNSHGSCERFFSPPFFLVSCCKINVGGSGDVAESGGCLNGSHTDTGHVQLFLSFCHTFGALDYFCFDCQLFNTEWKASKEDRYEGKGGDCYPDCHLFCYCHSLLFWAEK